MANMVPVDPKATETVFRSHLDAAANAIDEARLIAKRYGWLGMYEELRNPLETIDNMLVWTNENAGFSAAKV